MRAAVVVFVLLASACGGATAQETLPVLPESALPGLATTTRDVTASELAADVGPGATVSGFVAGRERVFQGESHGLDRVVARTLEFDDAAAARGYVDFLHAHVADLYGVGTTSEPLSSAGRSGYLIDPAACACHRAAPTLTAVVSRGPRVTYLEINGDGADQAALEALLRLAP